MNNYTEIIKIKDVDVSKLELQFPKEGSLKKNKGMFVYVKHKKQKLTVVLPVVTAPYGAGPQKDSDGKFSMGITFDEQDENTKEGKKVKKAYEKLVAINDRCRELMLEHKDSFFSPPKKKDKEISPEIAHKMTAAKYADFLRSRDEQSDIMYVALQKRRIKDDEQHKYSQEEIAQIEKEFISLPRRPLLVDNNGEPLPINVDNLKEVIPFGTKIKPVIEFAYLWSTEEKVYPVWTLVHGGRISTGVSGTFDILKDDDDEEEEEDEEEGMEIDGEEEEEIEEEEEMAN